MFSLLSGRGHSSRSARPWGICKASMGVSCRRRSGWSHHACWPSHTPRDAWIEWCQHETLNKLLLLSGRDRLGGHIWGDIWREPRLRHLERYIWKQLSGITPGRLGITADHLWCRSGIFWDRLESSWVIWKYISSFKILCDHPRSFGTISKHLESFGIILDHMGLFTKKIKKESCLE